MCLYPMYIKGNHVPCGRCIECSMQKSKEWAYRCVLEASLHSESCMVTLTYNEDNLPKGETLVLKDFQNFLKRLRKFLSPKKIRYFGCGEYGKKHSRPHYHILIFGWKPEDLQYFCHDNKNTKLYRSSTLEKLWTFGYSSVGEVTYDSCLYTAKYLQKKNVDNGKLKPFIKMSKKPGLGFCAFKSEYLKSDKIYLNGSYIKIPRYYLDKISEYMPAIVENVREKRKDNSRIYQINNCVELDNSNYKKIINTETGQIIEVNGIQAKKIEKFRKIFGKGIDKQIFF